MKPVLVGEDNPYGADPHYALYPYPVNSAGHRLMERVLKMGLSEYFSTFDRVNLCLRKWTMREARATANKILDQYEELVLLGTKVANAFGLAGSPFTKVMTEDRIIVMLPHPSGRCRLWNRPGSYSRARSTLVEAGILQVTTGGE